MQPVWRLQSTKKFTQRIISDICINILDKPQRGLTLLEMLITTLIVTLLITLATPGFELIHAKHRVRQITAVLQNQFMAMKNHALRHHTEVILCGTHDKITCNKDWSKGFMRFEDTNSNGKRDMTEPLISFENPLAGLAGFTIKSCSRRFFRSSAAGPLASVAGTITIVPMPRYHKLGRSIIVSRIGRTRIDTLKKKKSC